jgi:hypothetical protein
LIQVGAQLFFQAGYNAPMKFQSTDRFSISEEVLSQEVNGETVLLNLEGESYFGLNEVGTRVWQLLKEDQNIGLVLGTLDDEYDVSREQLENDVEVLLESLTGSGLIKLSVV